MRVPHPFPEIYCDLNAEMIERGYSLERRGSVDDLVKLGLTLAQAVGMRFTFVMDDADEHGNPDEIMFNGVVIHDQQWGYSGICGRRWCVLAVSSPGVCK
jgi:hypothetical protein